MKRAALFGIAAILFLWISRANAQSIKPEPMLFDGQVYASIRMTEGLPARPNLKSKLVSEAQYATITMADSLGTIDICLGKGTLGEQKYVLVHHFASGLSITALDFIQDTTGILRANFEVRPPTENDVRFPLDLRLNLSTHILFYRWLLSPEDSGVPGGVPTAQNMLLDIGKSLFDFTVTDLSGSQVRSSDVGGKVAVINWWGTNCPGCVEEIEGYNTLVRKYQDRVVFLAIAISPSDEVNAFLAKRPFLFQQTVAAASMLQRIATGIPHTIVLDRQGLITYNKVGGYADSYKDVEKAIDAVLGGGKK
jgi:peroxiredoxin